jgi:hypothetical protein
LQVAACMHACKGGLPGTDTQKERRSTRKCQWHMLQLQPHKHSCACSLQLLRLHIATRVRGGDTVASSNGLAWHCSARRSSTLVPTQCSCVKLTLLGWCVGPKRWAPDTSRCLLYWVAVQQLSFSRGLAEDHEQQRALLTTHAVVLPRSHRAGCSAEHLLVRGHQEAARSSGLELVQMARRLIT